MLTKLGFPVDGSTTVYDYDYNYEDKASTNMIVNTQVLTPKKKGTLIYLSLQFKIGKRMTTLISFIILVSSIL